NLFGRCAYGWEFNTEDLEILSSKPHVITDKALSEIDNKIERAIKRMGEHEVALITISLPSPNDSITIKFKATLTKHIPTKPIWLWTPEEKYQTALKYKNMAVSLVRDNRLKDAFYRFSKACKIIISMEPIEPDLELSEEMNKKIRELRTSLYNNMAMCQLKYNNYEHAIELCTKVLQRDENNVKALYRRGCSYGGTRNNEKAIEDLQRAIELEPNNTAVREKLRIYSEKWRLAKIEADDMVKRMFRT
ncbi:70 kDa peptidyl-prolyl isomerase-like, partial [Diachasma alloeum]|uniref:70 kDa peptidyl-prolyl isomerase-like n=1 Tax=Diachasma alloeum TaxID=454923 RepID=UPI0007384E48